MTVREILASKRAERVEALVRLIEGLETKGPEYFVPMREIRFDPGPVYTVAALALGKARRERKLASLRAALARAEAVVSNVK